MRMHGHRALLAGAVVAAIVVPTVALADHATFTDVPDGHTHAEGIHYISEAGITTGCTPTTYCPGDPLTRAQMGTFLYRSSGHDPATPPSVNAAELAGSGPSAYTTTVHQQQPAGNVSLDDHTSQATAAAIATIGGLTAGQYVVVEQVFAQGGPSARLVCRTLIDGTEVQKSIGRVGSDAGQSAQLAMPIVGAFSVAGAADLELRCHAENLGGAAPTVWANNNTHLVALRVGDAHDPAGRCGSGSRWSPATLRRGWCMTGQAGRASSTAGSGSCNSSPR